MIWEILSDVLFALFVNIYFFLFHESYYLDDTIRMKDDRVII